MNKGHFTGVIYVEVFQLDKDKQKIVTRTNNEGWKMGAETISLNVGDHYIIVPGSNGEIQSVHTSEIRGLRSKKVSRNVT